MLVLEVVHDARREDLVAHRRAPAGARTRIDHVPGAAQVVHIGLRRLSVHDKRLLAVARREDETLRTPRQRLLDHGLGDQDTIAGGSTTGRQHHLGRGRRLDAYPGAGEQRERRDVDRLDGVVRPDVDGARHRALSRSGDLSGHRRQRLLM